MFIFLQALTKIPRKAYYLATKVGRYENYVEKMFDFSAEKIFSSFEKSLKLLGVDYVDVIPVHDIEFAENINQIIGGNVLKKKVVDVHLKIHSFAIIFYCSKMSGLSNLPNS